MRLVLLANLILLSGSLSAQELFIDKAHINTKSKVALSGLTSAVCEAASQRARKSKTSIDTLCFSELQQLLKVQQQMMMFGSAGGPSPLSERFGKIDHIITVQVRDIRGTASVIVGLSDVQLSEPFGIAPAESRFKEAVKIDKHTVLKDVKDTIDRLFDHYEAGLKKKTQQKSAQP